MMLMEELENSGKDTPQSEGPGGSIEGIESELSELRENVRKTTSDLRGTVSSLKEAIVDIRSAISEIENPFNLLRIITSEKDVEKLEEAKGLLLSPRVEGVGEEASLESEIAEVAPSKSPRESVKKLLDREGEKLEEQLRYVASTREKPGFTMLKWIWYLLDMGLEQEDVASISQYCEDLGYLSSGSGRVVANLTPVVERARLKGVSVEDLILNIFGAAAASGIELDYDDVKEVVLSAIRIKSSPRAREV